VLFILKGCNVFTFRRNVSPLAPPPPPPLSRPPTQYTLPPTPLPRRTTQLDRDSLKLLVSSVARFSEEEQAASAAALARFYTHPDDAPPLHPSLLSDSLHGAYNPHAQVPDLIKLNK
jgi:hypothetical protein